MPTQDKLMDFVNAFEADVQAKIASAVKLAATKVAATQAQADQAVAQADDDAKGAAITGGVADLKAYVLTLNPDGTEPTPAAPAPETAPSDPTPGTAAVTGTAPAAGEVPPATA